MQVKNRLPLVEDARRSSKYSWNHFRITQLSSKLLYSIWLFTYSDMKTIIFSKSTFGVLSAVASSVFSIHFGESTATTLLRAPVVFFWTWINLLPFTLNNQRQPAAVMEDTVNKPWRPMPTRMLRLTEARYNVDVLFSGGSV
jgi:hypothetical protein